MSHRQPRQRGLWRFVTLAGIMAVAVLVSNAIVFGLLYDVSFEAERMRLYETAQSWARLIEAVARFDQSYSGDPPEGRRAATISQIEDAHNRFKGFGETGEFTLARRQGDDIVFVLRRRHGNLSKPNPVPFSSSLADPMRRALSGQSGTIIGLDYRGVRVLAAHEPLSVLGLGVVAKIDLAEIRAPFIESGSIAAAFTVALLAIGSALFWFIGNPLIRRLEQHGSELSAANRTLGLQIQERVRAEEALATRVRQQSALTEISQHALSASEPSVLMDKIVAVVGNALGVELCKILELLPDGAGLLLKAGVGWNEGLVGNSVVGAGKNSQAGYTLLSDEPVIVTDLRTERRFSGPRLLLDHGVVSGLSVIIPGSNGPFGLLGAHTATPREFTGDDANFLQTAAHTLAYAIGRHSTHLWLRKLSLAVEQSPVSVMITDIEGSIEYVNPKFTMMTGYEAEEVLGKNPRILNSGLTPLEIYHDLWKTIKSGREWRGEIQNKRKSGELYFESLTVAPMRTPDGDTTHFVAMKEDITERKQAQAQLIQASKLSTLGEIATGVAHELNQPLNVIKMAADSSIERIEDGAFDTEYARGKFERISAQIDRAAAIIDHMRIFGRRADEKTEVIDVREAVSGALALIGEQLRLRGIEVETALGEPCRKILGHAVQLEQVVLNLIGNARDAIEANRPSPEAPGKITLIVEDTGPEGRIRLIVRDTGGGIPRDALSHVFEPFFTTKEAGKGTGLGLSISYGIITKMGGVIEAANAADGAEITITLPAANAGADPAGAEAG